MQDRITVTIAEWQEQGREAASKDYYRQLLISAAFGRHFPSLDEIEEAITVVYLDKLPDLVAVAQKLGMDKATLYRKRQKWGI